MKRGVRFRALDGSLREWAVDGGRFAAPTGRVDEWIDATNGYGLAGLVDAHTHLTGADVDSMVVGVANVDSAIALHARLHVEGGVLLAADKGGRDDAGLGAFDLPRTERPELTMAGTIVTAPGGYYEGFGREVEPAGPTAGWIGGAMPARAEWVKLIGDWPRKGQGALVNFEQGALEEIVVAAHSNGRRVAIHTAAPRTPSIAVAAGVDSIEHGLFLTEDDLRTLGSRAGAWVPTVAAMEGIRDQLRPGSSGRRLLDEGLDNVRHLLPGAAALGVHVLAGTDLHLPHGGVAAEAKRLADFGLAPADALAAVTSSARRYFDRPNRLEEGDEADLVVVPGDPRDDLGVLARPTLVMRSGAVIRR